MVTKPLFNTQTGIIVGSQYRETLRGKTALVTRNGPLPARGSVGIDPWSDLLREVHGGVVEWRGGDSTVRRDDRYTSLDFLLRGPHGHCLTSQSLSQPVPQSREAWGVSHLPLAPKGLATPPPLLGLYHRASPHVRKETAPLNDGMPVDEHMVDPPGGESWSFIGRVIGILGFVPDNHVCGVSSGKHSAIVEMEPFGRPRAHVFHGIAHGQRLAFPHVAPVELGKCSPISGMLLLAKRNSV